MQQYREWVFPQIDPELETDEFIADVAEEQPHLTQAELNEMRAKVIDIFKDAKRPIGRFKTLRD